METFIRQHRVLTPQRGTIAIMAVLALLVITGMYGMVLDLGRVYNRRLEFDTVARAAVLAAAQQLNGTSAGIDRLAAEPTASRNGP